MRFGTASLFFIIAAFIFFVMWAVGSLVLTEFGDALDNVDDDLDAEYTDLRNLIPTAFGVIAAIFFVAGIVIIFVMDSLAEEDELYWRER